jgi:hypothetical protein
MSPIQSLEWIEKEMIQEYPLGIFKDETQEVTQSLEED